MKNQGFWITRILSFVLCLFIVIYMGYHILDMFDNSVGTVTTVLRTSTITQPVAGVIVRDEAVVPLPGGLLEFTVSESERVSRGQALAVSYQSEETKQQNRELQALKARRALFEYVMRHGASLTDVGDTDARIRQHMARLLSEVGAGRVATASEAGTELKTLIFYQAYSFDGTELLAPKIDELNSRIAALSESVSGVNALTADEPGLFSSVTDGLESVWTPALLSGLSVTEYNRLAEQGTVPPDSALYRIVRDWRWFYVFPMPSAYARALPETVAIRFGDEEEMTMRKHSVSQPEDGERVVILTSDRQIPYVFAARRIGAEIIRETFSGVRIPSDGVRIDMETGQRFVYCLILGRVVRKDVEIMEELNQDNYHLSPYTPENRDSLLPGDEVIVSGRDLFDGKILRR